MSEFTSLFDPAPIIGPAWGESHPDPTAEDPQWLVVDVEPVVPLGRFVTLQEIKADLTLRNLPFSPANCPGMRYTAMLRTGVCIY